MTPVAVPGEQAGGEAPSSSAAGYRTEGESAVGLSGVTFARHRKASAGEVTVENLDHTGLGTFTRR